MSRLEGSGEEADNQIIQQADIAVRVEHSIRIIMLRYCQSSFMSIKVLIVLVSAHYQGLYKECSVSTFLCIEYPYFELSFVVCCLLSLSLSHTYSVFPFSEFT